MNSSWTLLHQLVLWWISCLVSNFQLFVQKLAVMFFKPTWFNQLFITFRNVSSTIKFGTFISYHLSHNCILIICVVRLTNIHQLIGNNSVSIDVGSVCIFTIENFRRNVRYRSSYLFFRFRWNFWIIWMTKRKYLKLIQTILSIIWL